MTIKHSPRLFTLAFVVILAAGSPLAAKARTAAQDTSVKPDGERPATSSATAPLTAPRPAGHADSKGAGKTDFFSGPASDPSNQGCNPATTGLRNTCYGSGAGSSNITGGGNSFFGYNAGAKDTSSGTNSFFGHNSGAANTSGIGNAFFGNNSGLANTTGGANSFFGNFAGIANTTGNSNAFFGDNSGAANIGGTGNSFFGAGAGLKNTSGNNNAFFGSQAGAKNTTGIGNTFFGTQAGASNTTVSFNTFFGHLAGTNSTGPGNAFFGARAGTSTTAGGNNSMFGNDSGRFNTTGGNNSFFGFEAGRSNSTGNGNVFFGDQAGYNNSTGGNNVFIGSQAGKINTIASNNTYIGALSGGSSGITNATAIGANASVTQSNSLVLGQNANVGIGTSAPAAKLHVVGNATITGNLTKGGGSFKIDHPLDPANKYLYHSFVESPDMKNIYDGVAVLNEKGAAIVSMPEWFEALNQDFRYQLTCIGGFAPVYIGQEIKGGRFKIAGGRPGMKVSWQVTGIRHDAYAEAHRIPIEEDKPLDERGTYLHPESFDRPANAGPEAGEQTEQVRPLKQARRAGRFRHGGNDR
ncbi:MAG: hypothetical protein ACLGJB_26635 [Blastocatellia bacterium]